MKRKTCITIAGVTLFVLLIISSGAMAAPPYKATALVLVNSNSADYADFQHFIQPYLDNFGIPYTKLDIATTAVGTDVSDYSMIIIGHRQLDTWTTHYLDTTEQTNITIAVNNGTGLVNFDNDLSENGSTGRYNFVQDIFNFSYGGDTSGSNVNFTDPQAHYITQRKLSLETISTGDMTLAGITLNESVVAIATTGTQPFLAVTTYGTGRAVQWGSYDWMSHSIKGPLFGLDDLVWRSIVWAAHKPFAMQGLPPFVTMRMDDVSGPLWWIHNANDYGFIPWAGIFTNDFDDSEAADLSNLVNTGKATATIHAFGSSNFFYFDHYGGSNYSDATMADQYATAAAWFNSHNIPISKYLVPHYYEIGSNAFSGLANWGTEFLGTMMDPGQLESSAPWMMKGPFRLYETGPAYDRSHNIYYADYMSIPGHSEMDSKFFNCVTEIRDVTGYEWLGNGHNSVPVAIQDGTDWLKRALDSMDLATLFSHEYTFIGSMSPANWQAVMQGITQNIAGYNPIYVSMDYACQYVRAMYTSNITASSYDPATQQIATTLGGKTDMPTKFYLFTDDGVGIQQTLIDVPQFDGSTQVVYNIPGPLDHIEVSPNPATIVADATQQFTAIGYDVDNNPIPNLTYGWAVVNGGGTINSSGLFTAGITMGTYTNTVNASYGSIAGYATVQVIPPPDEGPGGPILVIASSSNPFTRYYAEILRTEGLNYFNVTDISLVDANVLADYDVVILGEMSLSAAQVTLFTNWVNSGGNLIAMRPDKQLAGLLGLSDVGSTLSNAYLLVNTASGPGAGIVNQTIQYHGTADQYNLNGATALATLYSNATTATACPAVTLRIVGSNSGQAAAFTYDLARSVVYTRQGNPAWINTERDMDATNVIRADDMFFGPPTDPPSAPEWVDRNKLHIPQADEQQRLLANLILEMNADRKPLPRFWYFPRGFKAVIVMTGDDHGSGNTAPRFARYLEQSPPGCSMNDWECVRASSYMDAGVSFTNAQAAYYDALGFELSIHVTSGCSNYTESQLDGYFTNQMSTWQAKFPSVPPPSTHRLHCGAWSDWVAMPRVELGHGFRADMDYYYWVGWPPNWLASKPGMFTGSGMPMRFADLDGTIIDNYQVTTQMTDESGQSYPFTCDALLDKALGPEGYYGAFCANMHTDYASHPSSDVIVEHALARGVPVVSGRQMFEWLDGRNGSSFGGISWNGTVLSFTVTVGSGARNLMAMVPTQSATGPLIGITHASNPVTYATETIKGIDYALFLSNAGDYEAHYAIIDTTPPTGTIAINSGASYTKSPSVTLTLSCTDTESGCSQMRFSNDNTTWSTPEAYAITKAWTLTSGNGTKTVYLKFKDNSDNWSTAYSDTIILDTVAPATTASPAGGTYNSSKSVSLTCTDGSGSGCDKIYYTTDGSTPTTSSPVYSGLINFPTTTTLKFFAADNAVNQETVKTEIYTIDTTPPTGTITINSGASYTKSTSVTLTLSCTDTGGSCTQMHFSNDYTTWSTPEAYAITKAWTLTSGDGIKTVYASFKDNAGNWSTVYSDMIVLDTAVPTTTASPPGGTYASAQSVSLTCNDGSGSGCDKIYYTTDGSTPTTSSPVYLGPTNIPTTTTLKFFATDLAENQEAAKTEQYTITIMNPDISVSPASNDFGRIAVNHSSIPKTFTISNTGTANLVISSIGMTGGDAGMFSVATGGPNPCPSLTPTIAPGGNCTINATFSPISTGAKSTTMRIISNDPDENPFNIPLSGTGTPIVECTLVPDNLVVPKGGTLGIQATAKNNTVLSQTFLFATDVTLPNGNKYPASGYLFGPISITLSGNGSRTGHLSHAIPLTAPLGTYIYHGYVGNYGVGIYHECTFEFTVTTP